MSVGAAELTVGIAIVFGLILLAAVLFATAWIPADMTAIGIAVLLVVLGAWTGVTPLEAISGFASPAVITVMAMFILSEGVRRTGLVQRVGRRLLPLTEGSRTRQLGVTLGLAGPMAGFVNNTPLVAVLIPMVTDLAKRHRTSPSALLMPLSFVSMMGGMLTVIGTSSNIVASDLSGRLLDHPISMFEFTPLGLLVLASGALYLMTLGRHLVPERIHPAQDLTQLFRMREYLSRLRVEPGSALAGRPLVEAKAGHEWDLDVIQIVRGGRTYLGPTTDQTVEARDLLTVRADAETLADFARCWGLSESSRRSVTDASLVDGDSTLVEATVPPGSALAGETLVSADFRRRHGGTVLAIRQGDRVVRDRIETHALQEGDGLLVLIERSRLPLVREGPVLAVTGLTPVEAIRELDREETADRESRRRRKTPMALGIVVAVVAVAAAGLLPIYVSALGGVVLMVVTGCLKTKEAYAAVSWDIIFLLAGIIPLGVAMSRTGAAEYLARLVVGPVEAFPAVVILGIFYLLAGAVTSIIGNNATVVLLIPLAIDTAARVGADPFAFVLAVTFAASAAFMTPMGNPANLMVFTSGGYRFGDFVRAGAPLHLLLAGVTTVGIALMWGV